jgi:predicted Zn-dependent protease
MQAYFEELADFLTKCLHKREVFTAGFSGEDSDFVRFNHDRIRQAGAVSQRYLSVDLIRGARHASGAVTLSGGRNEDHRRVKVLVADLRAKLPNLPEDPHLLYSTEVLSTSEVAGNRLPDTKEAARDVMAAGKGHDLVGILAAGGIHAGFANSFGQRNWFTTYSFNFDWSLYHAGDKAVKCAYAGFDWSPDALREKMAGAAEQLVVLRRVPKTIPPGDYRVYMAPVALADFVGMLSWGGFGLKSHRTKQTVLLKMAEAGATLHPSVTLSENTKEGGAPNFQEKGFLKPDSVTLIEGGRLKDCLVSPRSAKEFGVPTNGANSPEAPSSLDIAGGDLAREEILARLDTGVWINNVWYLNYSDRPGCRITGMTRFACFWVEKGRIAAPLNVMRFDETIYRALGENLLGLTKERDMLLDAGTYGGRSTDSARVPGALIDQFHFNL